MLEVLSSSLMCVVCVCVCVCVCLCTHVLTCACVSPAAVYARRSKIITSSYLNRGSCFYKYVSDPDASYTGKHAVVSDNFFLGDKILIAVRKHTSMRLNICGVRFLTQRTTCIYIRNTEEMSRSSVTPAWLSFSNQRAGKASPV